MKGRQPASIPSEEPPRSTQTEARPSWCSPSRSSPTVLQTNVTLRYVTLSTLMICDLTSAEQHHGEYAFCVCLTRLRLIQPSRNTRGHPVSGVGRQRHRDVDRIWDLDGAAIFVEELNADHGQSCQVGPPGLCTCRWKNHRRQLRQEFYRFFYTLE